MSTWMKHPRLDALIEVPDGAVLGHRRSGWQVTDPPPPEPTVDDLAVAAKADTVDERPTKTTTGKES